MLDNLGDYVAGGMLALAVAVALGVGFGAHAHQNQVEISCKDRGGEFHPFRNGAWICVKPGAVIEEQR